MAGSSQCMFSPLIKLPSPTADSGVQVGLGILHHLPRPRYPVTSYTLGPTAQRQDELQFKWLTDKFDKGETVKYIFFWGHSNKSNEGIGKFVFSQWYNSPFLVDDVRYLTAEQWMMAQKALLIKPDR